MDYLISPRARELLADILSTITLELSPEDAHRWADKFHTAFQQLTSFPQLGPKVPHDCFVFIPPNADSLHQLIIKCYRTIYEIVNDQICILSVRHCRQLLRETDTYWNDSPDEDLGADPDDLIYRS